MIKRKIYQIIQVLIFAIAVQISAKAQSVNTVRADSTHTFRSENKNLLWNNIYKDNYLVTPSVYRSYIKSDQLQAIDHFNQYENHDKIARNKLPVFFIACLVSSITSAVAQRSGDSRYRTFSFLSFGFAMGTSGLAVYHRVKAQQELKRSVVSLTQ